ncbi:MAG: hypothetical protein ACD_8C00103G0006 [uncultured bacterium]|nr:MAG: hypothetical protein ACD_8C00103G0006 [uncultured bacterium]
MNMLTYKKISTDFLQAIFIVAFVGLFVLANYFVGFNLPLYVVAMLVGAMIAFARPRSGLFAIIFLTFVFERFFTLVPIVMGRSEYKIYPIDVIFGALLIGIAFQLVWGKLKIVWRKIDWAIFAFVCFSVLYFVIGFLMGSGDSSLAFSTVKNYAFYSLFYFATFILIDSKEKLKQLAKVVFVSAIAVVWFVAYGIALRHGLWSDFTPLSTDGIRTLAFTHGFYLSMSLIITLVYVAFKRDLFSKWLLVLMPIWAVGVLGSMMRHLWISLFVAVVAVLILFATKQREKLKKYVFAYGAMLVILAILAIYLGTMFPKSALYEKLSWASEMLGSRVTSIANTEGDESILWRSAVWKSAGKKYLESPVFGIGFGQKVSIEIGSYHDFVEIRNMHNSFLVLFIQMGIFGIALVLISLIKLGYSALKTKFQDETLQIAAFSALGILVLQIVAFMFQPYLEANLLGIFFWINLGILRMLYGEKR